MKRRYAGSRAARAVQSIEGEQGFCRRLRT